MSTLFWCVGVGQGGETSRALCFACTCPPGEGFGKCFNVPLSDKPLLPTDGHCLTRTTLNFGRVSLTGVGKSGVSIYPLDSTVTASYSKRPSRSYVSRF